MLGYFLQKMAPYLRTPGASLSYALRIEFGGDLGERRFWRGVGNRKFGGFEWEGFSDPDQLKLVGLSQLKHPQYNLAVKTTVAIAGMTREFMAQIREDRRVIYGAKASVYFVVTDLDSYEVVGEPVEFFYGYCGQPQITLSNRQIAIDIDSVWASKNHPIGGNLSPADQELRYPGDRGLELVGTPSQERTR